MSAAAPAAAPAPVSMTRNERISRFGIDTGDGLLWDGGTWSPGGEHVKRLKVVNVSTATKHIRYKLPQTKFFFMAFPDEIILSPGNHVYLEVRFRPIRLEEYDDFIEFSCESGSFRVPVRARLARLAVEHDDAVAFGLVPVAEDTSMTLRLRNTGQVDAEYAWQVEAPFTVAPVSGMLMAGATVTVTFTVRPSHAALLRAIATLDIRGASEPRAVELTATSKFQHIALEAPVLDFGTVLLGGQDAAQRTVRVKNVGAVRATVNVQAEDRESGRFFTVRPETVEIPAGASTDLVVRYTGRTAGMRTIEHFVLSAPGGNTTRLECRASCCGPEVTLAKKERPGAPASKRPLSVTFGDIRVGQTVSQVVVFRNQSRAPAYFEFQADELGTFQFSEARGVIAAQLPKEVVISFIPGAAGNFYRRIICLIADSEPLYIDAIATAYDDARRPFPLRQKHVDAWRRWAAHVKRMAPEAILALAKEGAQEDVAAVRADAEWALRSVPARSGDRSRAGNAAFRQLFLPTDDAERTVALSEDTLDFGAASRARPPERQTVYLQNRSDCKMSVTWSIPPSPLTATARDTRTRTAAAAVAAAGGSGTTTTTDFIAGHAAQALQEWAIAPDSADVEPGATVEFKVAFRPSADSTYVCQELEAHVAPKVNRSFRLVDEEAFIPPVCLPLRVMGHTFRASESFVPQVMTSFGGAAPEQHVHLPPACIGEPVYYTFRITNSGDVPAAFRFDTPQGSGVDYPLSFYPNRGSVPTNSFVLVAMRFLPRSTRTYRMPVDMVINDSMDNVIRLHVEGVGSVPRVQLPGDGTAFIRPTAVGVCSQRTVEVKNTSRVPVHVRFRVPEHVAEELAVAPSQLEIPANAAQHVTLMYAPASPGHLDATLGCDVFCTAASEADALVLLAHVGSSTLATHSLGLSPSSQEERVAGLDLSTDALVAAAPGDPLQTLRLRVLSHADRAGVLFKTKSLDAGAVRCDFTVKAPITLVNATTSAVHFRMDAVVQLVGAAAELSSAPSVAEAADSDFDQARAEARAARLNAHTSRNLGRVRTISVRRSELAATGSDAVHNDWPHVQFEPAEGMLPANGELTIMCAVRPSIAGMHRLRIYCVSEVGIDPTGLPHSLVQPSRLAALSAAADAELDPREPSLVDWAAEPKNDSDLWCDLVVAADTPTVFIEDALHLTSREAAVLLFPSHVGGLHNRFSPPAIDDHNAATPGGAAAASVLAVLESSMHFVQPSEVAGTMGGGGDQSVTTAPKDLWLRPRAYNQQALEWGSARAVDVGWGGWNFWWRPSDAHSMVASPDMLWRQLSLEHVNRQLQHPAALNSAAAPPTILEFSPGVRGTMPMLVLLSVRNPTGVPAQFAFRFACEQDIELEPWVELPDVTGDDALVQELVQRRVFDIQPRQGRLLPGQAVTVRMHYAYATMLNGGHHDVPVALSVQGGPTLQLMLKGTTVEPAVPCLHVALPSTRRCVLDPVAVGACQPPMQFLELQNPSSIATQYDVDLEPLEELAAQLHGFPVFRILNPRGIIAAGAKGALQVVFAPLEAQTYEVALHIRFRGVGGTWTGLLEGATSPGRSTVNGNQADSPGAFSTTEGLAAPVGAADGVLSFTLAARGFQPQLSRRHDQLSIVPIMERAQVTFVAPPVPESFEAAHHAVPFEPLATLLDVTGGKVINMETQRPAPGCLQPVLANASYRSSAAGEAMAESWYAVAGVDATSASVSTAFNPVDVVTALRGIGDADAVRAALGHLLASVESEADAHDPKSLAQLFSGPDADTAASALSELLRAEQVILNTSVQETPEKRTAGPSAAGSALDSNAPRKSLIVPVPRDAARAHAYSLVSRVHAALQSPGMTLFRPGCEPSDHYGARPPSLRYVTLPHADVPESFASVTPSAIHFGDAPVGTVTHRLLVLRNTLLTADEEAGVGGDIQFAWDTNHPLVSSGTVRIHPPSGTIPSGGVAAVRVSFHAPATSQALNTDIGCTISVPEAQLRHRAASVLSELYISRQRTRLERQRRPIVGQRPHVSVAEKMTHSRAMAVQSGARDATIHMLAGRSTVRTAHTGPTKTQVGSTAARANAAARPAVLAAAGQMIARGTTELSVAALKAGYTSRPVSPGVLEFISPADAPASFQNALSMSSSPHTKPRPSLRNIIDDPTVVLAGWFAGDLGVQDAVLLRDDGAGVNMAAVQLPAIPTCRLFLHISGSAVCMPDFTALYSPQHAAAFVAVRESEGQVHESHVGGEVFGNEGGMAAARTILHELFADVVADVAALLAPEPTATGSGIHAIRGGSAQHDLTFDSVRLARGDAAIAAKFCSAMSAGDANAAQLLSAGVGNATQTPRSVFDAGLPEPRPGDLSLFAEPEAAAALGAEACKEAVARVVDGTIVQLMREALCGEWNITQVWSAPATDAGFEDASVDMHRRPGGATSPLSMHDDMPAYEVAPEDD